MSQYIMLQVIYLIEYCFFKYFIQLLINYLLFNPLNYYFLYFYLLHLVNFHLITNY